MNATLKRLRPRDDAVSPVIAVILMVALTVVVAAATYSWVSGYTTGTSPRSLTMNSGGAMETGATVDSKSYVVATASPGFRWGEVRFTLDGDALVYHDDDGTDESGEYCIDTGTGCLPSRPAGVIRAGDRITIHYATGDLEGRILHATDTAANAVVSKLAVG